MPCTATSHRRQLSGRWLPVGAGGRARASAARPRAPRSPWRPTSAANASPLPSTTRPPRERPQAPWHPLPLSELLIVIGGAAVLYALVNGPQHSVAALLAGLAAVVIGTLEVTVREHFSGYRSHAVLLAVLPVIVLHSAIVLIFSLPRAAEIALLALDLALAFVLFRFLRARYVEARRRAALARR